MKDYSNRFKRASRKPSIIQRIVNSLYRFKNRLTNNFSVRHAWLILGVLFVIYGSYNLFVFGYMGSILSIAAGGLIMYSSIHNFGGWENTKWEMRKLFFK